jgi:hypothetical protein
LTGIQGGYFDKMHLVAWMVGVTPLRVKHALTFQSISISYMFIITSNINSLDLKCVKHEFEPKWLHLLARVVELI